MRATAPTATGSDASDPRLALALTIARDAGRQALAASRGEFSWKRPGERVTPTDIALQTHLLDSVRARFPRDGTLAEESGVATGLESEFVWILDPLDGTNNYALGVPCFAVSLGVFQRAMPYAGVVHDPNTGFTCWALRDRGAWLGDRRLGLRGAPLTEASNVSARVPLDPALAPVVIGWLEHHKFRGFGSVALHLAYAALGAIDVVLDHQAALWDLAGGACVLREAGGVITDPLGGALFPFDLAAYRGGPVAFLAGNPAAHAAAVSACRSHATRSSNRPS
jgi:myo-inositol-1(or 4)-monophosphatase